MLSSVIGKLRQARISAAVMVLLMMALAYCIYRIVKDWRRPKQPLT